MNPRCVCAHRTILTFIILLIVALSSVIPHAAGSVPSFQALGDLPGGVFSSQANGLSADGSTVVGWSLSVSGQEAFRWTAGGGMVGLGDLPGLGFESIANATSAGGMDVVGRSLSASGLQAFRWTASGGMVGLGDLPNGGFFSEAFATSADGSVIVGYSNSAPSPSEPGQHEAFRWTPSVGMVGLGDLPGGVFDSEAHAVSADGSIIVGFSESTLGREAFRWTASGGMVGLGDLPGGNIYSSALAVSGDGSIIAGLSSSASGTEAYRWTSDGGMVGLGDLPGGVFNSAALGISNDGSILVGWGMSGSGQEASIWDTANGMRSIQDVLVNDLGLNLSGWTLQKAVGISDDGLTIVGNGTNPDGNTEGWIATIPEPSTVTLLALGGFILLRRRQ